MQGLRRTENPDEREFHQAVHEVAESVMPLVMDDRRYREAKIPRASLRTRSRHLVPRDVGRRFRGDPDEFAPGAVQFNGAIGPYKGGMRFHPSVTLSVLKFLGFEQTFKNSLTGLPMGGGKGGSNFDPKGKSDREVMRFCQSLMNELFRHIGERTDVPAGDIGVGGREVGFMFGQYRRLENRFTGVFYREGNGLWGQPHSSRKRATGYGLVYFTEAMLAGRGDGLEGARWATVSGAGQRCPPRDRAPRAARGQSRDSERLDRIHTRPRRDHARETCVGQGPERGTSGTRRRIRGSIPWLDLPWREGALAHSL